MNEDIHQDRTICQRLRDTLAGYQDYIDPDVYVDITDDLSIVFRFIVGTGEQLGSALEDVSNECDKLEDSPEKTAIESVVESLQVLKNYLNGGTYV